jgi:hypothetical protein
MKQGRRQIQKKKITYKKENENMMAQYPYNEEKKLTLQQN